MKGILYNTNVASLLMSSKKPKITLLISTFLSGIIILFLLYPFWKADCTTSIEEFALYPFWKADCTTYIEEFTNFSRSKISMYIYIVYILFIINLYSIFSILIVRKKDNCNEGILLSILPIKEKDYLKGLFTGFVYLIFPWIVLLIVFYLQNPNLNGVIIIRGLVTFVVLVILCLLCIGLILRVRFHLDKERKLKIIRYIILIFIIVNVLLGIVTRYIVTRSNVGTSIANYIIEIGKNDIFLMLGNRLSGSIISLVCIGSLLLFTFSYIKNGVCKKGWEL